MKFNFKETISQKGIGFYIISIAAILSLVAAIMYLSFSVSAHVFNAFYFLCLLLSFLIGVALFFFDDLSVGAGIVMVILLTLSFTLFIGNSINDIADYATKIKLYGNMNNAVPRFGILIVELIAIIVAIVGCFFSTKKLKNK